MNLGLAQNPLLIQSYLRGFLFLLVFCLSQCNNSPPPSLPKPAEPVIQQNAGDSTAVTPTASPASVDPANTATPSLDITNPPKKIECNDKGLVYDWVKTDPTKTCTSAVVDESICSQEKAPDAFGPSSSLAKPIIDQAYADGFTLSPKGCGRFSGTVVILIFQKVVEEGASKRILSKRVCSAAHAECE